MAGDKKDTENAGSFQHSSTAGSDHASGPSGPPVRSTPSVRRTYGTIYTLRVTKEGADSREQGHWIPTLLSQPLKCATRKTTTIWVAPIPRRPRSPTGRKSPRSPVACRPDARYLIRDKGSRPTMMSRRSRRILPCNRHPPLSNPHEFDLCVPKALP